MLRWRSRELLELTVCGGEFFVERLQLLAGGFEFLVCGLKLLVHRYRLLVEERQVLVRSFEIADRAFEFVVSRLELVIKLLNARNLGGRSGSAAGLALRFIGERDKVERRVPMRHRAGRDADHYNATVALDARAVNGGRHMVGGRLPHRGPEPRCEIAAEHRR